MKSFKYILLAVMAVFSYISELKAALTFTSGEVYRIVCVQWNSGSVMVGENHGKSTPVFYSESNDGSADSFWLFSEVSEGLYTIQNADTKKYITYDGVRDTYRRYISLTDNTDGTKSQWAIVPCEGGFSISCAYDAGQRMNVREGEDHIVGTYYDLNAPSTNEIFNFYDANGNSVEYKDGKDDDASCGIDENGGYWENKGIASPVVYTTDKSNPVLYSIKNVRSDNYVNLNASGCLVQTIGFASKFYFVKTSSGVNIFNEDGSRYVSGRIIEDISYKGQISTLPGQPASGDETWSFGFYSSSVAGYTIKLEHSSENSADNQYWNDYYDTAVGFFSLDDGCAFVFASSDVRHLEMLEAAGCDFSNKKGKVVSGLLINGKSPVYDKQNETYLFPAETEYRGGKDYLATVSCDFIGDEYELVIDGNVVKNKETYNFGDITEGRSCEIILSRAEREIVKSKLTFTFLPVVEVNGMSFSSNVYTEGWLKVNDADYNGDDILNIAAFRHRGATAASKIKKAYAVKLRDDKGEGVDRSFFGLRSDNNWVLDAMAIDGARMRNRVSTDLWLDFSTKPYLAEYEPKAINGTRGRFVEVLRNGYYDGIYCMTEKIDRKQLKLNKIILKSAYIPSDTVCGVLYKSTSWTYSIFMGHYSDNRYYPLSKVANYNNQTDYWDGWEMKYPDLGDGETIDWKPLYEATNLVASGNKNDFVEKVEDYFDLPVWRDYYLFIELMLATDNHGKNEYLYNYDSRNFRKMSVAPWDMDGTWGMRWDGSESITADATQDFITFLWNYEHGENNLFRRLAQYDYKNWNESLASRYAELRKTYFNPDSLTARFAAYRDLFKDSGADVREYDRWNGSDGISVAFDKEMVYLDKWIHSRVETLDKQYGYDAVLGVRNVMTDNFSVSGGQGQIIIRSDNGANVRIYNMEGVLVRRINVDAGVSVVDNVQKGIYIVNNHKVLVK